MKRLKRILSWFCIGGLLLGGSVLLPERRANADIWGGDLALLTQLIIKAVEQIQALQQIISKAGQTVSILEDMNRGVREVLRLADTAHITLPPQVYEQARTIAQATETSRAIYGDLPAQSPSVARTHYRSGTEGLFLSQDAFDYSTFLDKTGEHIKEAAVVSNQATATRLTAETLGVVLHAISHGNRLEAKSLEISATDRLQKSQKEAAEYNSYVQTHEAVENGLRSYTAPDLNFFSSGSEEPTDKTNDAGRIP